MPEILNQEFPYVLNDGVFSDSEVDASGLHLKVLGYSQQQHSENIIPKMTSNTSPSGTVLLSSTLSTAYYLFDRVNTTYVAFSGTGWGGYEFPEKKVIYRYTVYFNLATAGSANWAPKAWYFEGRNDDGTWSILHTVTNQTNWTTQTRTFDIVNTAPYKAYRIRFNGGNGASQIRVFEIQMMDVELSPYYTKYGNGELNYIDLGSYFYNYDHLAVTSSIPSGTVLNIYTSTSTDSVLFTDWDLINSDGTINSTLGRFIKVKIELKGTSYENDAITTSIESPLVTDIALFYSTMDPLYSGIMFLNEQREYYSTSFGEILQYLDFGPVIAGQTTLERKVILRNQLGYAVHNITLQVQSQLLPSGVKIELSKTTNPFKQEYPFTIKSTLAAGQEASFYVRISTDTFSAPNPNAIFEIHAFAESV